MTARETLLVAYDELISMAKKLKAKDETGVEVTIRHHDFIQETIDKYGDENHLPIDKWVTVSIYGFYDIKDVLDIESYIWEKYLIRFDTGYGGGARDWELDWSMHISADNNIVKMMHLYQHRKEIQDKIQPYEMRLININDSIKDCNGGLTYTEKKFISQKLWENFTDDEKEKSQQYHLYAESSMNSGIYTNIPKIFDPFIDDWKIISVERKDNEIKIGVSCIKNEGSISGLLTFLDVHYTDWIDCEEIYEVVQ